MHSDSITHRLLYLGHHKIQLPKDCENLSIIVNEVLNFMDTLDGELKQMSIWKLNETKQRSQ